VSVRLFALFHIQSGANRTETARYLKVSRQIVSEWAFRFYAKSKNGLSEKKRSSRPCNLDESQRFKLQEYIQSNSIKAQGGRLKSTDIVEYSNSEFNVSYSVRNVYRLLHQLNFYWITSRSKHLKQSEKVKEDFKKFEMQKNSRSSGL